MSVKYGSSLQLKKVVVPAMATFTAIGLAFALYKFEQFNYVTTKDSLTAMFGMSTAIIGLAIAFVAVDVAAIWRIFTPAAGPNESEPEIVALLWKVWAGVTGVDAVFDWFFLTLEMEKTAVQAPEVARPFLWVFPIVLSFVNWGLRFGLLYFFGMLVDRLVHGKLTVARPMQPVQTMRPATGGAGHRPQPGQTQAPNRPQPGYQPQSGASSPVTIHHNDALSELFGKKDQPTPPSGGTNTSAIKQGGSNNHRR